MQKLSGRPLPPALRPGLAFLLALILASGAATAATFTVSNLNDSGPGSLRQAVLDANASPGADDVVFAPGVTGTITLTFASGEILITDSLFIHGPGAAALTVSGNHQSRIFHVESPAAAPIDVTLAGLTLTQGVASHTFLVGGAVFAFGENLTILDSVISDSGAGDGQDDACGGDVGFWGGSGLTLRIADSTLTGGSAFGVVVGSGGDLCVVAGKLILERSTLSGGGAYTGGGLYLQSLTEDSTISSSTISGNEGFSSGGGIAVVSSPGVTVTMDASTVSGNTAGFPSPSPPNGFGGGVYLGVGGDLRIVNSTISGNHANSSGGGISSGGSLLLRLTTVTGNTASANGGSILVEDQSRLELDHAIVANGTPQDLAPPPATSPPLTITANYSLVEAPGSVFPAGVHNLVGVDPLLGPLANNGGPTQTHRPLPGSPVIDAGDPAIPSPPATDQRGFQRIVGAAVDLGSVEVGGAIIEMPTLSSLGIAILSVLLLGVGVWRLRRPVSGVP
jgi:hypothetical protein